MNLPGKRRPGRLPKRFPVGTTYVVEGRGEEDGHLRVFSRYVVLPGGRRINVTGNFGGPPSARARRQKHHGNQAQNRAGTESQSAEKNYRQRRN
jgi:hypothetical protein